jgi:integrase
MRLYQRGKRGTWWVDLGDVAGQRARRSTGTTDHAQAKEYAATLARDLWRARRLGETPRVTWDEAVVDWLAEHQHRRSIEEIKRVLRWLTQHLRGVALAEITDERIRRLRAARLAEPVNRRAIARAVDAGKPAQPPKPTSPATVNRHLAQLSAVLHHAHRRGWLASVPPIAKAAEPARRVAWITREQADQLIGELPPHLAAMTRFALATGLRETNIRLLSWDQVDLQRCLAWFEADQMKAGRTHTVPLNAAALRVLAAQRGQHGRWVFPVPRWITAEEAAARGDADPKPRQVADAPTGKISNHAWRKACTRAGVPWLRFHDLRHTWASWHVQAGTPLPVLQELGGWKSLAMVQRYAHLGLSHVAAWAGNLEAGGTTPAQPAQAPTNDNGPEGPRHEGKEVGWLMGLEPTTTRITRRSGAAKVSQINDLRARRKPKAA